MRLPKQFFILLLVVVALLGIAGFLGFKLFRQREFEKLERQVIQGTPTPVLDQQFDESRFTTSEYVNAVGRGTATELVQIRGIVASWEGNVLQVRVQNQNLAVRVPEQVEVRCMPEFLEDAQGKQVKSSEVYLDFSQSQVKGSPVEASVVSSEIAVGEDIMVQAEVENEDDFTAEFIVGYGCNIGLIGL